MLRFHFLSSDWIRLTVIYGLIFIFLVCGCGIIPSDQCIPDCTNKECGDDGCGGSCGSCHAPEICGAGGTPFVCGDGCVPECANKDCGDDSCGSSCGSCKAPETCGGGGTPFVCGSGCIPDCRNKECGDDGCGGSCGSCDAPETCGGGGIPFACGIDADCIIAEDGFEHGSNWEWFSGRGWEWHLWIHNGKTNVTKVVSDENPHGGTRHARLQGGSGTNKGYLSRKVHLQGASNAQLSFWWKARDFSVSDQVQVKVYDGTWHTVMNIGAAQADDTYRQALVDLSQYAMVARFYINFEASGLDSANSQFYVDDVVVNGNRPVTYLALGKGPLETERLMIAGTGPSQARSTPRWMSLWYDIDWEDAPQSVVNTLEGQGNEASLLHRCRNCRKLAQRLPGFPERGARQYDQPTLV